MVSGSFTGVQSAHPGVTIRHGGGVAGEALGREAVVHQGRVGRPGAVVDQPHDRLQAELDCRAGQPFVAPRPVGDDLRASWADTRLPQHRDSAAASVQVQRRGRDRTVDRDGRSMPRLVEHPTPPRRSRCIRARPTVPAPATRVIRASLISGALCVREKQKRTRSRSRTSQCTTWDRNATASFFELVDAW